MERYALNVWDSRFLCLTNGPLPALVSLPPAYDDAQQPPVRWPLILFLHGRGERGSDLEPLLAYGVPQAVLQRAELPFVTVSPQCPADREWPDLCAELLDLLRFMTGSLAIDPQHILLTGLSMGARGSWRLAVENPNRFAALAAVCGRIPDVPDFFERLAALRSLPIWVFHGAQDNVVPIANSDRSVEALRNLGSPVRYTVYPEADHDSWTQAYAEPQLWEWLAAQRLERAGS